MITVLIIRADLRKKKSNLHYTRGITQKRVTSGRTHLHGLARGLHSFEETSQRLHCADLTGPGIEPQTSRTDSLCAQPRKNLNEIFRVARSQWPNKGRSRKI